MEIIVLCVLSGCTYLVASTTIKNKEDNIAFLRKEIELINERIMLLNEINMDDKLENLLIQSVEKLKDDVTALKVEIGKVKNYITIMAGIAGFISTLITQIVFKLIHF